MPNSWVIIAKKLPGLIDVRDESTDDCRIVCEMKKDADPQLIMAYLYKHTPLQTNVQVNLTCLVPTENPEVSCADTLDNDCDGLADGADPDCPTACDGDGICEPGEDCLNCPSDCDGVTGGKPKNRFVFPEHHESHAASAFFPSPFEDAAILTADGVGEWATTSYAHGRHGAIEILDETVRSRIPVTDRIR